MIAVLQILQIQTNYAPTDPTLSIIKTNFKELTINKTLKINKHDND